uniref:Uncharacterized protein n=1 Tax=Ciona savignyi TaxID=51511 RepID=H2YHX9_CIOSA
MASTIVHQASTQQSCHQCVESLAIELAAKQLVNIWGERCPTFCRRVLNKVQRFDKIFQVPSDTNSMVFAPSISNSFYEANIINAVMEQAMMGVL